MQRESVRSAFGLEENTRNVVIRCMYLPAGNFTLNQLTYIRKFRGSLW